MEEGGARERKRERERERGERHMGSQAEVY